MSRPEVAIVHDYLTQTGGAERVVLSMIRAFPEAPVYTALFDPERTYPEFAGADVRPIPALNRHAALRRHQRIGLPLYGPAFRSLRIDAGVALCSSSGWAHQVRARGRKIVYCHSPARWLYESPELYTGTTRRYERLVGLVASVLRDRDQAAAASADLYLANSGTIRRRIREVYGIEADLLPPPPALPPDGPVTEMDLEPGGLLTVGRLFAYKNTEVLLRAARDRGRRLWVVGEGPDRRRLERLYGATAVFVGRVDDARLRWLYRSCSALVAAAYEDFGLTPLEANSFGRPVAALRQGGYLDTVVDGETGVFFDQPAPDHVNQALDRLEARRWDIDRLRAHSARFGEDRFVAELQRIVGQLAPSRSAA